MHNNWTCKFQKRLNETCKKDGSRMESRKFLLFTEAGEHANGIDVDLENAE